jgi:hypothetical protein
MVGGRFHSCCVNAYAYCAFCSDRPSQWEDDRNDPVVTIASKYASSISNLARREALQTYHKS